MGCGMGKGGKGRRREEVKREEVKKGRREEAAHNKVHPLN